MHILAQFFPKIFMLLLELVHFAYSQINCGLHNNFTNASLKSTTGPSRFLHLAIFYFFE